MYYELFWKHDVLVIPVKRESALPKLRYGNVQRAVSQMRSGIPVLLEIGGEVLEEFMERYNYTCAFVNSTANRLMYDTMMPKSNDTTWSNVKFRKSRHYDNRKHWSFDEAVTAMKNPKLRHQCQQEGMKIAKDFTPSRIAQKHLRALGFRGKFQC